MNEALRRCRDCEEKMNLVVAHQPSKGIRKGDPLKPIRYICRCGHMEHA